MSPVYRVKSESTNEIAVLSKGITERELIRQHKDQLKKDQKTLIARQMKDRQAQIEQAAEALARDRARLKEQRSAKTIAQQERERKEAVRAARRKAEYDIYREIMAAFAVTSALPLDRAHARAVAFTEHIIRHSPAGHQDVGFVGL